MSVTYYSELDTAIGPITIVAESHAITRVTMQPAADVIARDRGWVRDDVRLADARAQFTAYFAGELRVFSLPIAPRGSTFQKRVWEALGHIPFGETTSYGRIAAALGIPGSARAVGAANRTNPIGIIVPCHRVIGADGKLTGYAGGIERKAFLLAHEAAVIGGRNQLELGLAD